jgi:hypothetical protein
MDLICSGVVGCSTNLSAPRQELKVQLQLIKGDLVKAPQSHSGQGWCRSGLRHATRQANWTHLDLSGIAKFGER